MRECGREEARKRQQGNDVRKIQGKRMNVEEMRKIAGGGVEKRKEARADENGGK